MCVKVRVHVKVYVHASLQNYCRLKIQQEPMAALLACMCMHIRVVSVYVHAPSKRDF